MKEYKEITKEVLEYFINTAAEDKLEGVTTGYCWKLYKTPFDEEGKIDLLYISRTYIAYKDYNFIPENFELSGAICNRTGNILRSSWTLNELIRITNSSLNITYVNEICNISEDVSNSLTFKIKECWNEIKNNPTNKEIDINYTIQYTAREKAEKWFVEDNLTTPPEYKYNVMLPYDNEELLLEYYINKENVLSNLTNEYFQQYQQGIYQSVNCYEEACKLLPTLLNDEGLKIEKAIKDALEDIECNMVTVKASKETLDGHFTWEGKVELASLKNCKSKNWIYLWRTPLSEKKEFYNLFGKDADLFPEDIDEITFRKKTLYKKGE